MDILENGRDEPARPRRGWVALAAAVAVAIGVSVVRQDPGSSQPEPVATSSPPTASPRPEPTPTPTATEPTLDGFPTPYPQVLMPCEWFLGQVALPKLDRWNATVVSTERVGRTQSRTFARGDGTIRIDAACGSMEEALPAGVDSDVEVYVNNGSMRSSRKPAATVAVFRADGVIGYYRIISDGPRGSVLSPTELDKLMRAVAVGAKSVS